MMMALFWSYLVISVATAAVSYPTTITIKKCLTVALTAVTWIATICSAGLHLHHTILRIVADAAYSMITNFYHCHSQRHCFSGYSDCRVLQSA